MHYLSGEGWQAHFSNNMFVRPTKNELDSFVPDFTIINASEVINEDYENIVRSLNM